MPEEIAEDGEGEEIADSLRQKSGETRLFRNEDRVDDEDRKAEHDERDGRCPQRPTLSPAQRNQADHNFDADERRESEGAGEKMAAGAGREIRVMRNDCDRSGQKAEKPDREQRRGDFVATAFHSSSRKRA